jgi:osmotically-inducible protein OsmY
MSTQLEADPRTTYDRAELADVTVLVEDGVAVLRGIVESPARQLELERRAMSIDGVEQVENLVQLPCA